MLVLSSFLRVPRVSALVHGVATAAMLLFVEGRLRLPLCCAAVCAGSAWPLCTPRRPAPPPADLAAPPAMALCHGSARAGLTGCNNRSDRWLPFYSFDETCRLHNNSRKNPKNTKLVLFECLDLNLHGKNINSCEMTLFASIKI